MLVRSMTKSSSQCQALYCPAQHCSTVPSLLCRFLRVLACSALLCSDVQDVRCLAVYYSALPCAVLL